MSYKKLVVCLACAIFKFSSQLLAQGITIQPGAQLVASGSVNLVIRDAHFTNDGTFVRDNSTVSFTGDSTYSALIGGTSVTDFTNMIINRTAGDIELQQNINIAGNITMTDHDLLLGNYVADLGTTGTVLTESEDSKIMGTTTGSLNRTADLNSPSAENPGNIGLEITSSSNLGTTIIKRYNGVIAINGVDNSINRYYDITPTTNNTLDATVTIHYFDSELGALNESDLNIWSSKNSGANWKFYSKLSANTTSNTLTKDHIDTLARITLATNNINAVLAVKLLSFAAKQEGQYAKLSWITSQEINNDRFEIERSSDSRSFSPIGTVRSKGDNSNPQAYTFIDMQPGSINYYRLKMIDKDNTYEYSKTAVLSINQGSVNTASVYPVPVKGTATVKITSVEDADCKFRILDATGNTVYTGSWKLVKGVNTMSLPMSQLAGGTYYLHLSGIAINPIKLYKE